MESKHTSGPWEAVRSLTCGHLRAAHNYQVNPKEEWTDADLKLISAAPDMFKIIHRFATVEWMGVTELNMWIKECREIIQRVTE
jgi:hypothetical protein